MFAPPPDSLPITSDRIGKPPAPTRRTPQASAYNTRNSWAPNAAGSTPAPTRRTPQASAYDTRSNSWAPSTSAPASSAPSSPWGGVDPNSAWTGASARADLERRIGSPLTDDQVADARRLTGYDDPSGAAPMTGAQYNTLIREAARRNNQTFVDYAGSGGSGGGGTGGGTSTPPIWETEDAPAYEGRDYQPGPAYQQGTYAGGPGYQRGTYNAADPFSAPTAEQVANDPGVQFRQQQATRALDNSASARGMLRGTNARQDVVNYSQGAASQEYAAAYGRAADTYDRNLGERRYASEFDTGERRYGHAAATDDARYTNDYNTGERRYGYEAGLGERRYGYEAGVSQDQLRYAPTLMSWNARNAANQRRGELGFDREWQREVYNRDDARNRYQYGNDDAYRRWLEDNNNRRFLVGQGNY